MSILPLPQNFELVTSERTPTVAFKEHLDSLLERVGGRQGGTMRPLTDAPVITWRVDLYPVAVVVLGGNRTIASPTGPVAGFFTPYRLTVVQDATGGRLLTWGSAFKFPGGTPPTLSTAPNAVDEFWLSSDGTNMYVVAKALDLKGCDTTRRHGRCASVAAAVLDGGR
ncbi:MAG: hypothetical protein K2X87_05105, partial [Gemmataceae bacterium]|nr:hypothetical protein [Gemmataceae bacterium]